jgi:hypothetical protein
VICFLRLFSNGRKFDILQLCSLAEGGTPPRFLIIDDGWQQIGSENKEESNNAVVQEGAQYVTAVAISLGLLVCAKLCSGERAKLSLVCNGACRAGSQAG